MQEEHAELILSATVTCGFCPCISCTLAAFTDRQRVVVIYLSGAAEGHVVCSYGGRFLTASALLTPLKLRLDDGAVLL